VFAGKSSKGKHFDTTVSHWWASTGFSVGHQCRGTDELHLKSIAAVLFKKPICLCETVLQNYAALPLYGITVCGLRKKETLTWWHWWATAWQNGKLFFNHKKCLFQQNKFFSGDTDEATTFHCFEDVLLLASLPLLFTSCYCLCCRIAGLTLVLLLDAKFQ